MNLNWNQLRLCETSAAIVMDKWIGQEYLFVFFGGITVMGTIITRSVCTGATYTSTAVRNCFALPVLCWQQQWLFNYTISVTSVVQVVNYCVFYYTTFDSYTVHLQIRAIYSWVHRCNSRYLLNANEALVAAGSHHDDCLWFLNHKVFSYEWQLQTRHRKAAVEPYILY